VCRAAGGGGVEGHLARAQFDQVDDQAPARFGPPRRARYGRGRRRAVGARVPLRLDGAADDIDVGGPLGVDLVERAWTDDADGVDDQRIGEQRADVDAHLNLVEGQYVGRLEAWRIGDRQPAQRRAPGAEADLHLFQAHRGAGERRGTALDEILDDVVEARGDQQHAERHHRRADAGGEQEGAAPTHAAPANGNVTPVSSSDSAHSRRAASTSRERALDVTTRG
jgi:hypothetical protein